MLFLKQTPWIVTDDWRRSLAEMMLNLTKRLVMFCPNLTILQMGNFLIPVQMMTGKKIILARSGSGWSKKFFSLILDVNVMNPGCTNTHFQDQGRGMRVVSPSSSFRRH